MKPAGLLGTLLLAAACAKPAPIEERGRRAYAGYDCKRCHRIGSEGGTTGPDLTYVGFRKSAPFLERWLENPSAWQPDTLMPNFRLNPPTRRALAAYLATLKGQAYAAGAKPWSGLPRDRMGKAIYDTVGCATCHGRSGRGGYRNDNVPGGLVPPLKNAAEGFTRAELVARIADGRVPAKADPAGPEPMLAMPRWADALDPEEIAAVADYVLSLKPAGSGEAW